MRVELDMMDMASRITVHVRAKRVREWRVRVWLALLFIRLGVWISGMRIEVAPTEDWDAS